MKKKYRVALECTLIFEVDALDSKHAREYTKFLASRDTENIKVESYVTEVIGAASEDMEDLS